jgi:hypothetical protein
VERYKNPGGDSNVVQYELSSGAILVQFGDGSVYEYTNQSAGSGSIATMHRLAVAGRGLNTFISTTVRKKYSRKLPRSHLHDCTTSSLRQLGLLRLLDGFQMLVSSALVSSEELLLWATHRRKRSSRVCNALWTHHQTCAQANLVGHIHQRVE